MPSFFLSSYKIGLISYSFISFSPLLALSFFFTTSAREGNEALDSAGAGGLRQRAERPENLHGITERERGAYLQLTEVLRPLFHSPHFFTHLLSGGADARHHGDGQGQHLPRAAS